MDAEDLRDLGRIEFGIWLETRVGGAFRAAFVKTDDSFFPTPAFGQHAVRGEFRTGGNAAGPMGTAVARESDLTEYAAESVVEEVALLKGSVETFFGHPVAIVEGEAFGETDDIHRAIWAQPHGG